MPRLLGIFETINVLSLLYFALENLDVRNTLSLLT